MTTLRIIILITPFMIACVPTQNVRPLPDFVATAIEPGDEVKVVKKDGTELNFEVSEVRTDAICSQDNAVRLSDIKHLGLRSSKRPAYPCGGEKVLGCSIPDFIILTEQAGDLAAIAAGGAGIFQWHASFEDTFYNACVQHDFCYRHGFVTYGRAKDFCDNEFYANMKASCLSIDVLCLSAAREFYIAVRRFSGGAYRKETGTYCAYDGEPSRIRNQSEPYFKSAIGPANKPSVLELLKRARPRQTDLLISLLKKDRSGV